MRHILLRPVSNRSLPGDGNLAGAGIVPVTKSAVWIDLTLNSILPNARQVEKWEGMTIGPRLAHGGHVLVVGNDNDYSVTQDPNSTVQYHIYVDFAGNSITCPLDQRDGCELNGGGADLSVPANFRLLPGVLHSYRVGPGDLDARAV